MARPKKINDETLVSILDGFFSEVACGDFKQIKFTALEIYATSQGMEIKEHIFRRSEAVKKRIEELEHLYEAKDNNDGVGYRTLDISGIIKDCSSIEELKMKLTEIDSYWRSIYEEQVNSVKAGKNELKKIARLEKENENLKNTIKVLGEYKVESEKDQEILQKENAYLRQMIKKYIYPELAMELMRQGNLPVKKERKNLKKEAYEDLIEGKMPRPFSGKQGNVLVKKTREERLLEDLKRQVES